VIEPSIAEIVLPNEQIQQVEEVEAPETAAAEPIAQDNFSQDLEQDLEQIWQEAINQIQFRGTQVLLQQQGSLLFFDGHEARVGIKSQPLFKMAKEKLSTIEAAFEAVYQRRVRVSLEVTTAAEVQTPLLELPPPSGFQTNPPNLPTNGSPRLPPSGRKPTVKESSASSMSENATTTPTPYRQTSPSIPSSSPTPTSEAAENPSSTPIPWQAEDEVSGAAKSLAQFFNGQIVSFEDDLPASKIEEAALEPSEADAEADADRDDGEDADVPF
jgi:DNA polymerase-3 subunit gamma/tau